MTADELPERAHEVAGLYAAMPTRAVWETKRLLDVAETSTLPEQLELEATTQAEMTRTHDFFEGTGAFLQKREAAFTGAPLERAHPVSLIVHDDLRRWRLTAAVRAVLVFPHALVLATWTLLAILVALVNSVITLIKGRSPAGLHAWNERFLRYWVHVNAYQFLVADPFPRFRGWRGTYPVDLEVAPPAPQSRWKTILRPLLGIPPYIFAYVLMIVVEVVSIIGWFVAVAIGRYPRGFRDLSAYALRFNAQTYAFLFLLTDRWPSLSADDAPTRASSSAAARRT